MTLPKYCYWTVADGKHAEMAKAMVASARKVSVTQDFHIWSDRRIPGATLHYVRNFKKDHYMFKLRFLYESVRRLEYDYFVWLDADTYFVRNPGNLLGILANSPVHATLESDVCDPANVRKEWWKCPLDRYASLMRECGVRSRSIFNVNAGFWIVHRDVVEAFCGLCYSFWKHCKDQGIVFTEEAPLAYATHMLCGDPYRHTLRVTSDTWASDWIGVFRDQLPEGRPWNFKDYLNGKEFQVNPSIVHTMRSKQMLTKLGSAIRG